MNAFRSVRRGRRRRPRALALLACAVLASLVVRAAPLAAGANPEPSASVRGRPTYRALLARAELTLELARRLEGRSGGANDQVVLVDFLRGLADELPLPSEPIPTAVGLPFLETTRALVERIEPTRLEEIDELALLAERCHGLADRMLQLEGAPDGGVSRATGSEFQDATLPASLPATLVGSALEAAQALEQAAGDAAIRARLASEGYAWRFLRGRVRGARKPLGDAELEQAARLLAECAAIAASPAFSQPALERDPLSAWADELLASELWRRPPPALFDRTPTLEQLLGARPSRAGIAALLAALGERLGAARTATPSPAAGALTAHEVQPGPAQSSNGDPRRDAIDELRRVLGHMTTIAAHAAAIPPDPDPRHDLTRLDADLGQVLAELPRLQVVRAPAPTESGSNPVYDKRLADDPNVRELELAGRVPITARVLMPNSDPVPLPPAPFARGSSVWRLLPGLEVLLEIPCKRGETPVLLLVACGNAADLTIELPSLVPADTVLLYPPAFQIDQSEWSRPGLLAMSNTPWRGEQLVRLLNAVAVEWIWPPTDETHPHEELHSFLEGFLRKYLTAGAELRTVAGRQAALEALRTVEGPAHIGGSAPDGTSMAELLTELLARYTDVRLPSQAVSTWLEPFARSAFGWNEPGVGVMNLRRDESPRPNIRYVVREVVRPFRR